MTASGGSRREIARVRDATREVIALKIE